MGKTFTFTRFSCYTVFLSLLFLGLDLTVAAQAYTDGPMILRVRLREFNVTLASPSDNSINLGGLTPPAVELDEYTFRMWGRDNADLDGTSWDGFNGGTTHTQNYNPPGLSNDFNDIIFDGIYNGPNVPRYFDLKLEAFEDDIPSDFAPYGGLTYCNTSSRNVFDSVRCCIFGCLFGDEDDDIKCTGNPFASAVDYRAAGPPCQWNDHGFVVGTCTNNSANNFYRPHIESFWQYTKGTACFDAISLGNFAPGSPQVSHFNSTECYSNNFPGSPGNDVYYEINVTQPMGLRAFLCGSQTNFDTYLYLLDNTCTPINSNDDFCGAVSEINTSLCTPGTYYLVVDGATAAAMGTFTLTVQENPSIYVQADAGNSKNVCAGLPVQIGGSPSASNGQGTNYTYAWTNGANPVANPLVTPTNTTLYTLTVTDSLGCVAQDTVTVNVNPLPQPNLGPNLTICPVGSYTLDAGPGYLFYGWNTGATTQTVNVTSPGVYFVGVTDANGCTGGDTVQITPVPVPPVNLGPDQILCNGDSAILNAGAGFTGYQWSTGSVNQSVTVKQTNSVYVTVTDASGCTNSDTIAIQIVPNPSVNLGPDQMECPGNQVVLDAGPGLLNYSWNNSSTSQFINVNQPGTYDVEVSTIYGCVDRDTITVGFFPQPSVSIGASQAFCQGNNGFFDAGPGWSSYAWNTGATSQTIQVTQPGTYYVNVLDANGCPAGDTSSVTVYPNPTFSLGPDTTLCPPDVKVYQIAGYPGILWQDGSTNPVYAVTQTGTNSITAVVTDVNGCQASDQAIVTIAPPINLNPLPDTIICTGTEFVHDAGSDGGTPYTYNWSTGSNNQQVLVNKDGTYWVRITDQYGCTASDTGVVTTSAILENNIYPDTIICAGETLLIDIGPGYEDIIWTTGNLGQVIPVYNATTIGVVARDLDGCIHQDEINVTEISPPVLDLGPDMLLCPGDQLVLDAGPGFDNYLWQDNSTAQTFTVSAGGIYGVIAAYFGCEQEDQVTITEECPEDILIPNVFSPNGDGFNDVLDFKARNLELFELVIFDRWGKVVFTSTSNTNSWDGNMPNGGNAKEGVYYFGITYKFQGGEKEWKESGNITLVR